VEQRHRDELADDERLEADPCGAKLDEPLPLVLRRTRVLRRLHRDDQMQRDLQQNEREQDGEEKVRRVDQIPPLCETTSWFAPNTSWSSRVRSTGWVLRRPKAAGGFGEEGPSEFRRRRTLKRRRAGSRSFCNFDAT